MRVTIVAGLMFAISAANGYAQDVCSTNKSKIVQATSQYISKLDELHAAERDLGNFAGLAEEEKLKAVRRFGVIQRDIDAQRSRVLSVYQELVAASCAPFNLQGYDRAVSEFRHISDLERETLSQAKRGAALKVLDAN